MPVAVGLSRRTLVIGFCLITGSICSAVFPSAAITDAINRSVWSLCVPIQSFIGSQAAFVNRAWHDVARLSSVNAENERLKHQVEQLSVLQVRVDRLKRENRRLTQLLEFGETRKDLRLLAADVRRRSNSPYFRTIGLDIGASGSAVEVGMPVISSHGLVGQIRRLTADYAEVLLVTDPRTAVDVVLEKSRVRGIAVGSGDPREHLMTLKYIDRSTIVVEGERVLTTGDDGRFPADLLVGVAQSKTSSKSSPFQGAGVRPSASLDDLRAVYIVLGTTGLSPDGGQFVGGDR
ncbi:MAG: rod shape-determining protein MreC [Myxococcota bacterium]|nr:rod shape-determining protein MreC [Myxococcota bacterium]